MKSFIAFLLITITLSISITPVFARSGCCSYHGGVMSNGCGCNDGTPLSSTCAPYYSCTVFPSNYTPPVVPPSPTPIQKVAPPVIIPSPTLKLSVNPSPTPNPSPSLLPSLIPSPKGKTAPTQPKKSGGFFSWLLSLFGR